MRRPHRRPRDAGGNGDISDLGRRFVDCFVEALDDAGLPDDPEFRTALRAYMEWAVADVLAHEEPADVPAELPMPRWDWTGCADGRRRVRCAGTADSPGVGGELAGQRGELAQA